MCKSLTVGLVRTLGIEESFGGGGQGQWGLWKSQRYKPLFPKGGASPPRISGDILFLSTSGNSVNHTSTRMIFPPSDEYSLHSKT